MGCGGRGRLSGCRPKKAQYADQSFQRCSAFFRERACFRRYCDGDYGLRLRGKDRVVRHGAFARRLSVRGWSGLDLCHRGLAYGKIHVAGTSALTGTLRSPISPFSVTQAFDHSNVNAGWVVGFGTEGKLSIPGWTYKIEGLYMDLGHLDTRGPGGSST